MLTDDPHDDGLETMLASLATHDASPARVERIRRRASAMCARRGHARRTPVRLQACLRAAEPALALGLGVRYFAGAVVSAMAAYR